MTLMNKTELMVLTDVVGGLRDLGRSGAEEVLSEEVAAFLREEFVV